MCQELRTVSGPSRGLLWVIHYCYPLCRRHRLGRAVHRCTVSEQEWRRSFAGRGPSVRLGILWKRAPQVGTARGRGWWVGRRVDEVVRPDRAALGGSWTVALRWGPHRSASLTLTRTLLRGPGPQCPPQPAALRGGIAPRGCSLRPQSSHRVVSTGGHCRVCRPAGLRRHKGLRDRPPRRVPGRRHDTLSRTFRPALPRGGGVAPRMRSVQGQSARDWWAGRARIG